VNSVLWSPDGTELVSAHAEPRFELKLWQVDKLQAHKTASHWFTKVKDLTDCHEAAFTRLCLAPSGESVCALSTDETISLWKLFSPDDKPHKLLS